MRGRGLIAALALGAAAAAGQASACSWANDYAFEAHRTPAQIYAEAATVDWIRVEPPGPAACARPPEWVEDEDALDRAWEAHLQTCPGREAPGGPGVQLTAEVIERLKGASPDRFTLVHDLHHDGDWDQFSDLRAQAPEHHLLVAVREKATADRRHRSDAFWLDGDLGPSRDGSSSCGGWPTLDPRMSYVAFRDAHGGVIALEPVLHDDDVLLARLRRARMEPDALLRRLPVADFFRSASRMAVVRVGGCARENWAEEAVRARLLRGDPDDFAREADEADQAKRIDVDFLHDWFTWTGTRCGGQTLLVVEHGDQVVQPAEFDLEYGYAAAPEARTNRFAQHFAKMSMELPGRFRPRAVPVRDGRVRLSELSPAADLEPADSLTVDQAFAWFAEGRAGRAGE